MGLEARSNHQCQGMGQLRAFPGSRNSVWRLEDTVITVDSTEADLFDGVDKSLSRLKAFISDEKNADFVHKYLTMIEEQIHEATLAFDATAPWKCLPSLRQGLRLVRKLLASIDESQLSESARYELKHRLVPKERDFEMAIALAHGIAFDPVADSGEVTRNSTLNVNLNITNRSPLPVELQSLNVQTPNGWTSLPIDNNEDSDTTPTFPKTLTDNMRLSLTYKVQVGDSANYDRPYWTRTNTSIDRFELIDPSYFGLPWRPPSLTANTTLLSDTTEITLERPVQYRYKGSWVGTEKQKHVSVLPLVSVTMTPSVVVFPSRSANKSRPVSVSTSYNGQHSDSSGTLRLEAPLGWTVSPPTSTLSFTRKNQAVSTQFLLTPPNNVTSGTYKIRAVFSTAGNEFSEGVQKIIKVTYN